MARTNATNFTAALQFPKATAATDLFKKEDVQVLAEAVDQHDHSAGKGVVVNVAGIAAGAINGSQITDNTITSAKITDGTIATADLANAAVTNAKLASDTARANLLVNGGFEIWQRGNGPFTAAYTADRWVINPGSGSTFSVTRVTGMNSAGFALQTVYTHSAASGIIQDLMISENPLLLGKTVTFSADVNASAAGAAVLSIVTNGAGAIGVTSSVHPGGSTWQRLTVSGTINTATTDVQIRLNLTASATVLIDNAMVVVGSQAADYAPQYAADDTARCQRYYEPMVVGAEWTTMLQAVSATSALGPLRYRQLKPGAPTCTITNPTAMWCQAPAGGGIPCTAVTGTAIGTTTVGISATVASGLVAGNATMFYNGGGTATLVMESNP